MALVLKLTATERQSLADLDQVKDVVVSGIQAGEVLKWNARPVHNGKTLPKIAVPGALVFVGQIDATTQYPPAADIICRSFLGFQQT